MIGEQALGLLSKSQQTSLLALARSSLKAFLIGPEVTLSPQGMTPQGSFVTLRRHGQLRGCIGHALPRIALDEAIWRLTRSAAQDRRFEKVRAEEVDEIDIEVSVLTPLEKVDDLGLIEAGRDGLMVRKGLKTGLLLPKVAKDRGWDRDTFLSATCQKAGLEKDAWQDPELEVFRFQCQVFSEDKNS